MNSDILLNEASHIDEVSWDSLIGGLEEGVCNEYTCNCYGGSCNVNGMEKPGCISFKETAPLITKKHLPIDIAKLSY